MLAEKKKKNSGRDYMSPEDLDIKSFIEFFGKYCSMFSCY